MLRRHLEIRPYDFCYEAVCLFLDKELCFDTYYNEDRTPKKALYDLFLEMQVIYFNKIKKIYFFNDHPARALPIRSLKYMDNFYTSLRLGVDITKHNHDPFAVYHKGFNWYKAILPIRGSRVITNGELVLTFFAPPPHIPMEDASAELCTDLKYLLAHNVPYTKEDHKVQIYPFCIQWRGYGYDPYIWFANAKYTIRVPVHPYNFDLIMSSYHAPTWHIDPNFYMEGGEHTVEVRAVSAFTKTQGIAARNVGIGSHRTVALIQGVRLPEGYNATPYAKLFMLTQYPKLYRKNQKVQEFEYLRVTSPIRQARKISPIPQSRIRISDV